MSDILEKFNICSEISQQFKQNIKLFHVFEEKNVFIVTKDDKVFAFGSNKFGKCGFGLGLYMAKDTPHEIPELNGKQIKQFFIGGDFVLALNENNHVFGWGKNGYGQLGRGYTSGLFEYLKPAVIPELENIIEISCGSRHSLALDEQGNVFSWGWNHSGQVGCGKESGEIITEPVQLKELPKIKSIHCCSWIIVGSFAVTFDGLVYSWGKNRFHCFGHKSREKDIFKPELICGLNNVISVGCSDNNTYFLTNEGTIYFCGKSGSREEQLIPRILKTDLKFQSIQTIENYSNNSFNSNLLALSEQTVYYLERNSIQKTKYKTYFDYCLNETNITFKTFELKNSEKKFEELGELGSGGFGRVVQMKSQLDQTVFAVKIISIQSNDKKKLDQINKEVELLSQCNDKYVAKYFDSWIENDLFYIRMELFSDNLRNIIENKRKCFERKESEVMFSVEYFISSHLMKELLECVQYLHQSSPPIIHRDLKPANILVNYNSENERFLKLCDFGLATLDNHLNTTSHTANVGTLKYVSPEVLKGKNGRAMYSTKSDIFSLGFILCELFDVDINESLENTEELTEKRNCLGKRALKMLSTAYKKRPTCSQLLSEFEFWGIHEISGNYKKSDKYRENVLQLSQFENQFFYNYFIKKKNIF